MWTKALRLALLPALLVPGAPLPAMLLPAMLLPAMLLPSAALAEQPLSAIDWLSQSLAEPQAVALPKTAIGSAIAAPDVTVQTLGLPVPDAIGILSTKATGLPHNLWGVAPAAEIEALITAA